MNNSRTGNNRFLKKYNQERILDEIRIKKRVSRSDLAESTGLSATAAGTVVSALLSKGYICETGEGKSTGGRKPILLELKRNSWFSIGIDVDTSMLTVVVCDITGAIVLERTLGFDMTDFKLAKGLIASALDDIFAENLHLKDKLIGIGISIPGLIDSSNRSIVLAPNLGWKNVNLKGEIEKIVDKPVYIENEAMSSAICENWIGLCTGFDNFVCINIKSGIGAGIFIDGRLYRGKSGTAGELGHFVVDENGPRCGCGNYGCLEALASTNSIISRAKRIIMEGAGSALDNYDTNGLTLSNIVKEAEGGDNICMDILIDTAEYLGIAISNVVNLLNPQAVIIGKDYTAYSHIVDRHLKEVVKSKSLDLPSSDVTILKSRMGEKTSAAGAAIIPIRQLFGR